MKSLLVILAFLAVVTGHGVQHLRNGSSTQSIIGGTPTSGQEYPFFVAGDKVSEACVFGRLPSCSSSSHSIF